MRIRGTKPEFWWSETIAQLDWDTRLVLKALESYVDDNGVGKDSVTLFVTAAFPHDVEKSPEIFAKVARSLSRLAELDIIVRYTVGGERLVYVRRWKKWQYIDKPKQGRYPRPDGTMNYREEVDESIGAGQGISDPSIREESQNPPEDCAKTARKVPEERAQIQSGEQGNRGTGEQGEETGATALRDSTPPRFQEFWDAYPLRRDRRKAEKAFRNALKRAGADEIIAGARRYEADPNRAAQYTKYAEGWLNADGWLDEPLPARVDRPTYRNGQPLQGADLRAAENANIASLFTTGPKAINQ